VISGGEAELPAKRRHIENASSLMRDVCSMALVHLPIRALPARTDARCAPFFDLIFEPSNAIRSELNTMRELTVAFQAPDVNI
jgi:hypothetical protein